MSRTILSLGLVPPGNATAERRILSLGLLSGPEAAISYIKIAFAETSTKVRFTENSTKIKFTEGSLETG